MIDIIENIMNKGTKFQHFSRFWMMPKSYRGEFLREIGMFA